MRLFQQQVLINFFHQLFVPPSRRYKPVSCYCYYASNPETMENLKLKKFVKVSTKRWQQNQQVFAFSKRNSVI